MNFSREDSFSDEKKKAEVFFFFSKIVEKINKKLQPYQRITKITILEKPLEMTTTMKVKRNF